MSSHVHHSDHEYRIATLLVDYSIGETVGSAAARSWRKRGPSIWESDDSGQGTSDFGCELVAKTLGLLIVVLDGLSKLGFSRFEDLDLHDLRGRPIPSMASLAGRVLSSPLS
jgi:hypothetical protein